VDQVSESNQESEQLVRKASALTQVEIKKLCSEDGREL